MFGWLRAKSPRQTLGKVTLYEVASWTAARVLGALYARRVFHPERVPATGPCLLVANHQSYLDPPVIGSGLRHRHIQYVARLGLFRSAPMRWVLSALNAVPIREDGSGDVAAIKEVLRRLEAGEAVLIFPEGTRSDDGAMAEFKRGVAVLVKRARCPVIPVAIEGAFDAWPRHRRFPKLGGARIAVMFGEPVDHDHVLAMGAEPSLKLLSSKVDAMRMELRAALRSKTQGRFPPAGPGDRPLHTIAGQSPSDPKETGPINAAARNAFGVAQSPA
jgi:1-acyl-sn-glycerol-3-phosphate acyltransferase